MEYNRVSLAIKRAALKLFVELHSQNFTDLVSKSSEFDMNSDSVFIFWRHVKWFGEAPFVNELRFFLNGLEEENYHLFRLGKKMDDIEEAGTYSDPNWNLSVIREIEFDSHLGEDVTLDNFL